MADLSTHLTDHDPVLTPPALDESPPIGHLYPRRSDGQPPQVGDIARCGWVKKNPPRPWINWDACPECVVCAELSKGARRYPR